MNPIRNTDVVAIDLTAIDFTLQFASQVGLPCEKGLNIKMLSLHEGKIDVSVLILDLSRNNEFNFSIQENPSKKTWEVTCIYTVDLSFGLKTPESDLPKGFKHINHFKAQQDETGKFKFDRI